MDGLGSWNPEAGFFHMATRDVAFARRKRPPATAVCPRSRVDAAGLKTYRGAKAVNLPRPERVGEFPQVLKARRTWRRYSSTPVTLDELSTILGLTAGVQRMGFRLDGQDPRRP